MSEALRMPETTDQAALRTWAETYFMTHGHYPIAGGDGEGEGGGDGGSGDGGEGAGSGAGEGASGAGQGGGEGSGAGAGAGGEGGSGGDGGSGEGGDGDGDGAGDPEFSGKFDEDRAKRAIKQAREAEDKAKKAKQAAEKKLKDKERQELGEKERLQAEKKDAEDAAAAARREAREAKLTVQLAGPYKLGEDTVHIASPSMATDQLLKRGLEFDEAGNPVDLDSAVESLLAAEPILKGEAPASTGGNGTGSGQGPGNGNAGAGSGGQGTPPQLTPEEVKAANEAGMSLEQFASLKKAHAEGDGKVSIEQYLASRPKEKTTT